jgi:WD40 repeat protein
VIDDSTMCVADSVHVVDSADGPIAVSGGLNMGDPAGPMFTVGAIVLATGEERELPIPGSNDLVRWSVTTDRLLTAGPDGFRLYDLATGDEVPMADIDAGGPSDVVLAPDGASVAVITGDASGPTDVSVYDVATGEQRFTEQLSMAAEGAQLSYDGTTLAYGNYYDSYGPFTVIDLASGARHTIDAHGVVL